MSMYHLAVNFVDSPLISRGDVEPTPAAATVVQMEFHEPELEPQKEADDLPPPITIPRQNSPAQSPVDPPAVSAQPPQNVLHPVPTPRRGGDVPNVTPTQLLPGPFRGHIGPGLMQPLFHNEYPQGYPAVGFPTLAYPVDDMYGETVHMVHGHPGYVSPTGYTTTPYWTRPPEIDTQESVYEVENEHGIRDEEFRSMNIVRELFNRIGKQVSKEELPSYIVGHPPSVPGSLVKERPIGECLVTPLQGSRSCNGFGCCMF